jgi:hypothetical protein
MGRATSSRQTALNKCATRAVCRSRIRKPLLGRVPSATLFLSVSPHSIDAFCPWRCGSSGQWCHGNIAWGLAVGALGPCRHFNPNGTGKPSEILTPSRWPRNIQRSCLLRYCPGKRTNNGRNSLRFESKQGAIQMKSIMIVSRC